MKKKLMLCVLCACMAAGLCACKVNVNVNQTSSKEESQTGAGEVPFSLSEDGGEQSIDEVPAVVDSAASKEQDKDAVTVDATLESDFGYRLTYDPKFFEYKELSEKEESYFCKTQTNPPVSVAFRVLDNVDGRTPKEVAEDMAKKEGSGAEVDETEIGDGIPAASVYLEDKGEDATYVFVSYVFQAGSDLIDVEISSYVGCDSEIDAAIEQMIGSLQLTK